MVRPSPRPTLAAPSGRTGRAVRPAWERPRGPRDPRPEAPAHVVEERNEEWDNGWGTGEWTGDTKAEWEGEFWDEGQWNEDEQGEGGEWQEPADQGWTDEMEEWEADEHAEWAAPVQPPDSDPAEAEAAEAEWHHDEAENEADTAYHLTLGGNLKSEI